LGLHLDQRSALEVDAVVEPARHKQDGGEHRQHPRQADEHIAPLDDLPARVVRKEVDAFEEEPHGRRLPALAETDGRKASGASTLRVFWAASHHTTSSRAMVKAV